MSKESRSRTEQSRSMNTREADHHRIMQNIMQRNLSQFHMDDQMIPKDKQYYFGRDLVAGSPDMYRISELRRMGFSPVSAERHPELCISDTPWRKTNMEEYIYRGGQILLEREKIYEEVETKMRNENQLKAMQSIPTSNDLMNDHVMPMRSYSNETSISKCVSFKGE